MLRRDHYHGGWICTTYQLANVPYPPKKSYSFTDNHPLFLVPAIGNRELSGPGASIQSILILEPTALYITQKI